MISSTFSKQRDFRILNCHKRYKLQWITIPAQRLCCVNWMIFPPLEDTEHLDSATLCHSPLVCNMCDQSGLTHYYCFTNKTLPYEHIFPWAVVLLSFKCCLIPHLSFIFCSHPFSLFDPFRQRTITVQCSFNAVFELWRMHVIYLEDNFKYLRTHITKHVFSLLFLPSFL